MRALGRTSGVEMEYRDYTELWTIREGKVVGVKFCEDRQEPPRVAGVEE